MMQLLLGPVPLTENQEGALTSLVYNIGPGNDSRKTGWKYSPVLAVLPIQRARNLPQRPPDAKRLRLKRSDH